MTHQGPRHDLTEDAEDEVEELEYTNPLVITDLVDYPDSPSNFHSKLRHRHISMIGCTVFTLYLVPFFTSSDVMVARLVCRLWNDMLSTRKYRTPIPMCRVDTISMLDLSSAPSSSRTVRSLVTATAITATIQICTYVALTELSRSLGSYASSQSVHVVLTGTIATFVNVVLAFLMLRIGEWLFRIVFNALFSSHGFHLPPSHFKTFSTKVLYRHFILSVVIMTNALTIVSYNLYSIQHENKPRPTYAEKLETNLDILFGTFGFVCIFPHVLLLLFHLRCQTKGVTTFVSTDTSNENGDNDTKNNSVVINDESNYTLDSNNNNNHQPSNLSNTMTKSSRDSSGGEQCREGGTRFTVFGQYMTKWIITYSYCVIGLCSWALISVAIVCGVSTDGNNNETKQMMCYNVRASDAWFGLGFSIVVLVGIPASQYGFAYCPTTCCTEC